jgi:hypothetical protein
MLPVRAAAATMTGLMRTVRPVGLPWRPLKLRFEEEAQSWSPMSLSGFIARHMEQPAARHSKPASLKILSRPSCFGEDIDDLRSGNGDGFDASGDLAALDELRHFAEVAEAAVGAGADEGDVDLRALDRLAGGQLHVGERFLDGDARWLGGGASGVGTFSVTEMAWSGLVPQVTVGGMSSARMFTTSS